MAAGQPQILIVGAGPTGLTAALELARRGFRPRVIDKAPGPTAQSGALGINPRTLEILEPSGVTPQLLSRGNRVGRVYVVENGVNVVTIRIENLKHRYPFILIVPQSQTERLLTEAASDLGIDIEWNSELMELELRGNKPLAAIANADDIEYRRFDVLIGADGAHSSTRRLAGFELAGRPYPVAFALADIRYQLPRAPSSATIELFANGAVVSVPIDDRTVRYLATSEEIVALVRQRRSGNEILWQSEYHVSFRHVQAMSRGGIFLVGDAAHIHSPVGAHGMNLGIEDAAWLAFLMSTGEAQSRYSSTRLPAAQKLIKFARRQTDQLLRGGQLHNLLRRYFGPMALSLPLVEQAALRRLAGVDIAAPPWLDSDPTRCFARRRSQRV